MSPKTRIEPGQLRFHLIFAITMKQTLFFLLVGLSLNLVAAPPIVAEDDRQDMTLAVSYTTYDLEQNVMQIIFADQNDSKVKYKIFSEKERLKSVGGFLSTAGMNYVNVDISYYESGTYILEMNNGVSEVVYYFNINRPTPVSASTK